MPCRWSPIPRTLPQVLREMIPTVPEWLVASDADVPVCVRCLAEDDAAERPRFRRGPWGICSQVHCSQHRVPLVDMRGWRSGRLVETACVDQPLLRNANGSIVALGRRGDRGLYARAATRAICQLEVAIRGALDGKRPHAASWGEVDPEGFLRVVRDVATFVLNRFKPDDPRALLCVRHSHGDMAVDSVRSFDQLHQRKTIAGTGALGGFVSLAQVGKVGRRRSALYWTRELMHARIDRSVLPLPLGRERHVRQTALLAGQSNAGIEWLSERARQWPERYRRQRWWSLEAAP